MKTFCEVAHPLMFNRQLGRPTQIRETLMRDQRKPPVTQDSRPEAGRMPADSEGFSLESTTMRLKSMRLRREEIEKQEADKRAATSKQDSVDMPRGDRPSGRVRHDERGMAVWDWAVASGEYATLSATHAMKKLEVADLKIEETQGSKGPK